MKKIAIFASGNGTNFEALARACADGLIPAQVELCVCDNPGAFVEKRAQKFNVPVLSLSPKQFSSKREYEEEVKRQLEEKGVDFIFLAGYMRIIGDTLLNAFPERIVNIHPSLLPAFPGLDAIGQAMNYGVKVYGVTIHFVDKTLDGGKIIAQDCLHYDGDDREILEPKIHDLEHNLYVKTAAALLKN